VQPSRRLRAANAAVKFTGRDRELADLAAWRPGGLAAWREDPAHPGVAVRLIHGPGGQGKTRLAGRSALATRTSRPSRTLDPRAGPTTL
jgi:hypothetical protein